MGAVFGIYLLGLAVSFIAGVALTALLDPGGRWIGVATLPLGFCLLVTLLYPLGAAMPGSLAAPVAVALLGIACIVALALRLRRIPRDDWVVSLREALLPTRRAAATIAGGTAAGLLLLVPTMEQGFSTTIAVTNNDGWGYATLVDWLKDHPFPRDVAPNIAEPLTLMPWTTDRLGFGFGFERFGALLATLIDRHGFEVVNAAAAVGLAAAVGGWIALAAVLRPRIEPLGLGLVGFAVASPVLILPFVENYTTQFVSLCLWPYATAAFAQFAVAPSWRRVLVATVATGAVIGVYPATALWLVVPIGIIALLLTPAEAPLWRARLASLGGPGAARRGARAVLVTLVFATAVFIVSPIQVYRGVQNLLFVDSAPAGGWTTFFSGEGYAAFFLGGVDAFSLFGGAAFGWATVAVLILLAAVLALAYALSIRLDARLAALVAISGSLIAITLVIVARYRLLDDRPYQVYKALISGGAILAGLVLLQLIPGRTSPARTLRLLAIGVLAAIWIPVASRTLEASVEPGTGFRARDVEMGGALGELPPDSTLLVEGAAPDGRSFQLRMMASYFAGRSDLDAVGLGSTASYLTYFTPGGLAEWRPSRPWTDVLSAGPQPIATSRTMLWSNGVYSLSEAPTPDVTPFGAAWYPSEVDGTAVFAWTSGPVELVVSNRRLAPVRARLEMKVASFGTPRTLSLSDRARTERRRLPVDALVPVGFELTLPPDSTTPALLGARPAATTAPDGRRLMLRVQEVRVTPTG